jgi:hypothetical protein
MSARREDRPKFPENFPGALANLIQRCWAPLSSARPSFSDIVHQMSQIQFQLFPDVTLDLAVDAWHSNAANTNGPAQNP